MLTRIECLSDPQMDMDWFQGNRMRSRVEVTLTDGRVVEASATFPGDKPKYGHEQVVAKLVAMSNGLLDNARVAQIVATVDRLDKLDDVGKLARLLVPAKPKAKPKKKASSLRR
jgi:hypothetical protein